MTRVAAGQADFQVGDPARNHALIAGLLEEAAGQDADILVLPELANSGYAFESVAEARACAEEIPSGPLSTLLKAWSRPRRSVVCGICERAGRMLYNSAVIFTHGELAGVYRKLHLFDREKEWFTPGNAPAPVVSMGGIYAGVMICFDWFFPETARSLALRGAQLILHPANLVLPWCQDSMITRSLENHVFTVTANRSGEERQLRFSGRSQITSPGGKRLAQAERDGVIWAEIDPAEADDKRLNSGNDLFADRRLGF